MTETDFGFDEEIHQRAMTVVRRNIALFADRTSQRWVVRDQKGQLWALPPVANGWEDRKPFELTEETQLEPIPAHYRYFLGVPF